MTSSPRTLFCLSTARLYLSEKQEKLSAWRPATNRELNPNTPIPIKWSTLLLNRSRGSFESLA
jgi:hypothetical protein